MYLKQIDLDTFPTDETAKRMMERISPIYDQAYVMKWLQQVIGIEYGEMKRYIKSLPLQRFPEVATWGIKYLEQKYDIESDEAKPLERRRALVMAARPYRGPINPKRIETLVENVSGIKASVTEYPHDYLFRVDIDDTGKTADYEAITRTLDRTKPSHLDYTVNITGHLSGTAYVGAVVLEKYSKTVVLPYNDTKDRGYN